MKTTRKTMSAIILGITLLGFAQMGLTSCKKTYDCHCVKKAGGDEESEIKTKSKSDAETECKAKQTNNSSTYSECHLD